MLSFEEQCGDNQSIRLLLEYEIKSWQYFAAAKRVEMKRPGSLFHLDPH